MVSVDRRGIPKSGIVIVELSQYVFEAHRRDEEFVLYRGEDSNQPGSPSVFLLAPASMQPALETLKKIEYEYSLRDELDSAWAVRSLALSEHRGQMALVLEDLGGETLDRFLPGPMGMTRFLRFAVGTAAALSGLHEKELIHKDVKPANVLVNPATGQARLMGFGIASRLPRERQAPEPPEFIAGTLAYMAPEQTGRMNRSIDSRSDLYALGVTLYEMVIGTLPFTASDAMELVHAHIARQPVPPGERLNSIPGQVSAIVMKLLAKTAEERYQTAAGAASDLRRCLDEWETRGWIDEFPLGEHDTPDRLLIPEKLYGRASEIETLLAAFDRIVAGGRPELVLVSGYSGIGKSSVVNELHKPLVPPRGLFASGKFDQYKHDIPYATLAQAFQSLIRLLLSKNEKELSKWRDALREALDPNGQLIVDLVPELKLIIGEQPPVLELPPQDAQGRFQLVFGRFIGVFTREHPLALFLDDLQWLDAATLDLMEDLLTRPDLQNLMLIGAYRDNEVNPTHPLMRKLEAIRQAGAIVQDIVLTPLAREDLLQLVADSLHCEPERAKPLAQLIHDKTAGNPFFGIQFFSALAEEGLLRFDRDSAAWVWDLDRIRAKGYSSNVVDLMVGKLQRLSDRTQTALQQLACLGNVAEIATLTVVFGQSEEEIHASLLESVRTGLILRVEGSYAFLHDRIQEAALALIPESERAVTHLRIGRALLASMTADSLADHLFDVANQLNRGAALLVDHDEKVQVAAFDLSAGRKAKASAAYASARVYFAAGMALLDESDWGSHHELTFSLWLERAECEILTGNFETAAELIVELLQRAASNVEFARASCLKVDLHVMKGKHPLAIDSALTCLRLFGIDLPAHPTWEQVQAEYETVWQTLNGRPIESLIDLPLMTDPELQAVMQVLSVFSGSAYFAEPHLWCLQVCRMVNFSIQHGTSGASAFACALFGLIVGHAFHRYREGYRFGRLACDWVEKHGFISSQAPVYGSMGVAAFWTQPIGTAIDFTRAGFRTATETGLLTWACYSMFESVTLRLLRNDSLDAVWRESERGLDSVRKTRYRDIADIIVSQQRFIATMQGRTATFSTFSDAQFDEAAFEAQLIGDRMPMMICYYWIGKLKARFLSGDYAEALAAADKAKALLWGAFGHIVLIDYYCYTALAVTALYETASTDEQRAWRQLLRAHQEQLREWAENYPPTFADKHALVLAEVARIEKRDADALRLYEQAVHSAREHDFVQDEGLAHELAAQYCLARGLETAGYAHLRCARNCYDRWGAHGKVKQLDERFPRLREERSATSSATIGRPVGQLDVEAVVKASQALSSEMILPRLIEKLVRIAVEHAGAERGLLILVRAGEPWIEAEAMTGPGKVEVVVRQAAVTPSDLPQSALHYVIRTQEGVLLDDASADHVYSKDEYVRQKRSKSILCLPIVKQTQLLGALYLENNLTPSAFTANRVTVLQLLASQAAISLENAGLYSDLQRSEAFLSHGQRISQTGSFGWSVACGEIYWSEEIYNILEYNPVARATLDLAFQRIHPGDQDFVRQTLDDSTREKKDFDIEHRLLMPDGRVKHVHVIGRIVYTGNLDFVGAMTDVTAAKKAQEKIRQSEKEARQLLDLSPLHITELGPEGARLYTNRASLDYYGITLGQWQDADLRQVLHPQDAGLLTNQLPAKFQSGSPFEYEVRLKRKDGRYRWFHYRVRPMSDEQGRITRWYAAGTDIEERKLAEQRLKDENVALREEIDKASMFEEIVGTSAPLKEVLSRVSKVAPTNSSVLITGETGTGKELVARAIHRRSRRSSHVFVSVNCAAIPRDLVASELFGHEKGAFTGATQRRLGRFEMADRGTMFLDEVGELLPDTQAALLRVLQEREFDRVGGGQPVRVDVRVIAATNRDLNAAAANGTFRQDLLYRLNVFPIEMPPLRERKDDILILVEYFVQRYASRAGRNIRSIDQKTLDLLQSYDWPGNIRELQNVIERSIILSSTDVFSVDELWLSKKTSLQASRIEMSPALNVEPRSEREIIEAALAETRGRVSGSSGAAAKLRIPSSTLATRIKALKINKQQFKFH
jgi:PAS domain S-box-containing protein